MGFWIVAQYWQLAIIVAVCVIGGTRGRRRKQRFNLDVRAGRLVWRDGKWVGPGA